MSHANDKYILNLIKSALLAYSLVREDTSMLSVIHK